MKNSTILKFSARTFNSGKNEKGKRKETQNTVSKISTVKFALSKLKRW